MSDPTNPFQNRDELKDHFLVERLHDAKMWFNSQECCGQKDSEGVCAAPACIYGEAMAEFQKCADIIERLTADRDDYKKTALETHNDNAKLRAELAAARERASKYQRLAAELSDRLNGTPCAEIRWQQERAELLALMKNVIDDDHYHMLAERTRSRISTALNKGDDRE